MYTVKNWDQNYEFKKVRDSLYYNMPERYAGAFQTFDWFVGSRKKVLDDVVAVEMEGYAMAEEAQKHSIPFAMVKAVSDVVPENGSVISMPWVLTKLVFRDFWKARKELQNFHEQYFNAYQK